MDGETAGFNDRVRTVSKGIGSMNEIIISDAGDEQEGCSITIKI